MKLALPEFVLFCRCCYVFSTYYMDHVTVLGFQAIRCALILATILLKDRNIPEKSTPPSSLNIHPYEKTDQCHSLALQSQLNNHDR